MLRFPEFGELLAIVLAASRVDLDGIEDGLGTRVATPVRVPVTVLYVCIDGVGGVGGGPRRSSVNGDGACRGGH